MSIDPLCEKYYWISPYAYVANNPIKYIDPDGRVIRTANVTHKNASGRAVTQAGLSKNTDAAMRDIMKTTEGRAFFSQFAKAGQTLGGYTFKEDGALSSHNLDIVDFSNSKETANVLPPAYDGILGVKVDENGKGTATLKLSSMGMDKNEIGEVITHETQLHGYNVADKINGNTTTTGDQDHKALKNKDSKHQGYKQYNSVRGQLEEIDENYKKTFQEAEEHAKRNY